MGYDEIPCQLCGVSFNINRIRMKDEPRLAAMGAGYRNIFVHGRDFHRDNDQRLFERLQRSGDDPDRVEEEYEEEEEEEEEEDDDDDELKSCSSSTGCCMVLRPDPRKLWWEDPGGAWLYEDDPKDGTQPGDPTYEYQSPSDDETLEYDSETSDQGEILEDDYMDVDNNEPALGVEQWLFQVSGPQGPQGPQPPEFDTEFLPIDLPLGAPLMFTNNRCSRTNRAAYDLSRRLEHVAGPGCRNWRGNIGKHISTDEMRGCHTVQAILSKKLGSEPRSDDLAFERGSSYFLTGIAEKMPAEGYSLDFYPVRYGADNFIQAETNFHLERTKDELRSIALPFHPTCFELYIQATRLRDDRVDLDTLVYIRDQACIERKEFPVSYSQDVVDAADQWWRHHVGHEYLVANPVFVPGLRAILESAISTDENFSVHNSAFKQRPQPCGLLSRDPFRTFSLEIILNIANRLSSSQLATMRLSSRAFTHLPIWFFRQLVLDEMPWLYEAWSPETKPYYWATVVARDLLDEKQERAKFDRELKERREVIYDYEPQIYNEFVANEPEWISPERPEWQEILDIGPLALPRARTNWYKLMCGIRSNWSRLKGLRNRERIWENVNEVVDAIQKARAGLDFYLDEEEGIIRRQQRAIQRRAR